MRRRVVNPRDRYPDVAMAAIYALVKEGRDRASRRVCPVAQTL